MTKNNVGSQLAFDASPSFHLLSLKTVVLSSRIPKIHPLEKQMYIYIYNALKETFQFVWFLIPWVLSYKRQDITNNKPVKVSLKEERLDVFSSQVPNGFTIFHCCNLPADRESNSLGLFDQESVGFFGNQTSFVAIVGVFTSPWVRDWFDNHRLYNKLPPGRRSRRQKLSNHAWDLEQ